MMKRFSRRRRGASEAKSGVASGADVLPSLLEKGIVEAASLEAWTEPEIPTGVALIGQGERADGTKIIVSYSAKSATAALLGGLSAAQYGVEKTSFAGQLVVVAPQWSAGARRLLGLLGRLPYAVEPISAPALASGRLLVEAESGGRVLASNATQLASRMSSVEARTAFTRAAIALEGLAAKHGGCVRVGIDRLELVVLARRVAEIRTEGDKAVLEIQIGGRSTTPLSGADLAGALDGLEGQIRRRLNDRKVRDGEEGLRGRVVAQLAGGTELRSLCPWPVPGADLDAIDAAGVNAEGDPVVVAVREEMDWTTLGAVLETVDPLSSLFPVLFANTAPPLKLGSPRLLLAAEKFADGLERALAALTIAYELRKVSAAAGADVSLVSSGGGDGAQARAPRRGRRRGGRGRSNASDESNQGDRPPSGPSGPSGPAADQAEDAESPRRGPRREARSAGASEEEPKGDGDDSDDGGRGRGRRRRRSRRGRSGGAEGSSSETAAPSASNGRGGRGSEANGSDSGSGGGENGRAPKAHFEELSMMDLDDVPAGSESGTKSRSRSRSTRSAASEGDDSGDSDQPRRGGRRGRRGGRGDSRRGGGNNGRGENGRGENGDEKGSQAAEDAPDPINEEDLVDADDLSEILARLTEDETDFEAGESTEESFEDSEEIDEDASQSARRRAGEVRRRSRKGEEDDSKGGIARGRAAILVHADRDSLLSAILLARDIRQLEGMWIYPQEELMTFFRSIATDLRDDTPIFVVGFSPSPARDVVQASALYRGRLAWFGRQAWPPEDLVALRESLGKDAVHGGEGIDSALPLVLETCSRRSRFSDKLVDLATGRFTQHDFERWGRLWRWRTGEIAGKTGDIRADIAALLAGRPSDLAKEAALVELPPAPEEVAWVAKNDFRLVHFGGHVMVVVDVEPGMDVHLCARVARERYSASLSLAHIRGESTFIFGGEEINGKRTLDCIAVADHLSTKLEWVDPRPDSDHVSRFHIRDLDRYPERLEEVVGEIAMGRSLLER